MHAWHWLILYGLVFLSALALSGFFCALARTLAQLWGLVDTPGGRKAHARPIPVTGGYGIFFAFIVLIGAGLLIAPALAANPPSFLAPLRHWLANIAGVRRQVLAVLGGVSIVFVTGAIDDRRPLGPWVKLGAQIVATLPLLGAGLGARGFLPGPLPWLLTAGWVVLLCNSFNLLDNMDGLSASVALVICLVLSVAAAQGGERWLPALFLCLAGALGGFLIFNFNPASLFMGDAGSLTIGYLMAVFSVLVTYYTKGEPSPVPVLMPVAIMGVPLFDTLSVMVIRWHAGKPLMVGDRNHFSHRLLAMGFTVRETALTIALLAGASGLLALPLRWLPLGAALVHLTGLVALFGVVLAMELVGRLRK